VEVPIEIKKARKHERRTPVVLQHKDEVNISEKNQEVQVSATPSGAEIISSGISAIVQTASMPTQSMKESHLALDQQTTSNKKRLIISKRSGA
jgi:hypothetical protein